MSTCTDSKLAQLLVIVEMRKTQPVQYSVQKPQTLWDGGDRVEERSRRFYVTLRHFSGEIIGQHVGLVGPVEKLENGRGERRTYRIPVGTKEGEHLCVYVYNPAVCENGTLPIEISTVDMNAPEITRHQHAHQAVLTFHHQNMHNSHVARLFNTDDNYLVELHIFLEDSM